MRKILFGAIIFVLLLITACTMTTGIKIGNFQILSIDQMIEKNMQIDSKIAENNKMISIDYPENNKALKNEKQDMLDAKDRYVKLLANSSETEILKATMQEGYQIDFLYTTIGNHAKKEGVWTEMKIVSGEYDGVKDIKFTVEGPYVGITNFIYAIENDTKLNYRIKEFKLVPKDTTGSVLKATFTVKNVRIEGQLVDESLTSENSTTADSNNNTNTTEQNNTNTIDTTNTVVE